MSYDRYRYYWVRVVGLAILCMGGVASYAMQVGKIVMQARQAREYEMEVREMGHQGEVTDLKFGEWIEEHDFVAWNRESWKKKNYNFLLHAACAEGNEAIVRKLLAEHCEIDVVNERGETALYIAARKHHHAIVKLLVMEGAFVFVRAHKGTTALELILKDAREDIYPLLRAQGVKI